MNDRIRALAKPHLLHERFSNYGESIQEDYYEFYPDELEKFVHAIVRECADIARHNNLAKAERSYLVQQAIKQRFGVEE